MFTSKLKSLSMQTLRSRCSGLVACGARRAKRAYEPALVEKGFDAITTEILPAPTFYFAETYHQQYLAKHPHRYCGLGGTGGVLPDRHGRQRGGLAKRGRWRSV